MQSPAGPPSALLEFARAVPVAGDPYPPISGREFDGASVSLMEMKRITPRSPRAALEPEQVPMPRRRSRRARSPIVVAGNALFTIILLLGLVAGGAAVFGKQRFEQPGPLAQDKLVNIPRGIGSRDIAELLTREGVINQPWWVFVGGVIALKARDDLKSGEYQFKRQASLRDVVETLVEGKVIQHQLTIPEGLTSEQIVARLMENPILDGQCA